MDIGMQDQLRLEAAMVHRGAARFNGVVAKAVEHDREFDTEYGQAILRRFCVPIADALGRWCEQPCARQGGGVRAVLLGADHLRIAYIALHSLLARITREQEFTSISGTIGRALENECRFMTFYNENPEYMDTMLAACKKRTANQRYMHRIITHAANRKGQEWKPWSVALRVTIGSLLLDLIRSETGLIEVSEPVRIAAKRSSTRRVRLTADAANWISSSLDAGALARPLRLPCVIPPDDWTSPQSGGYYTPGMCSRNPLILGLRQTAMDQPAPQRVMAAVNTLQRTAWAVNVPVLAVMQEIWDRNLRTGMPASQPLTVPTCPFARDVKIADLSDDEQETFRVWKQDATIVHNRERERVSKCLQIASTIRAAQEYTNVPRLYYVTQLDFRGRMYCATTGFSPQGLKVGKGLLKFADGMRLGERGAYWFLVHGANMLGYDKVSYDDRIEYIKQITPDLLRAADNPLSYREVWGQAGKPWQFLAWLFEFAKFQHEGESLVSHLPIALDGSCNGLQHFSAMLRDPVGGAAVNLVPGAKPNDIYATVADVVAKKLQAMPEDPMARAWLAFGIDRELVKRPVMTVPYNSTRASCTKYLADEIIARDRQAFDRLFLAARWLTDPVWDSIGEVVVAARRAMGWITKCTRALAKENIPLRWTSPSGLVVRQADFKVESKVIRTFLHGNMRVRVGEFTNKLDPYKQTNGASPNFVHSMDAAHLVATVNAAAARGIRDFAMIHDDYGTHAANTETLHSVLREEFVRMYEQHDVLQEFYDAHKGLGVDLPKPPAQGALNLRDVLASPYFFG